MFHLDRNIDASLSGAVWRMAFSLSGLNFAQATNLTTSLFKGVIGFVGSYTADTKSAGNGSVEQMFPSNFTQMSLIDSNASGIG